MRQDRFVKGALPVKHQDSEKDQKKFFKKNQASSSKINTNQLQNKEKSLKKGYPPCQQCGKTYHPHSSVGKDQMQNKEKSLKNGYPPCQQYGKTDHPHSSAGKDQMQGATSAINLGMKLSFPKQNLKNRRPMLKLLTKVMKIKCLWLLVFQLETPQIISSLTVLA